MAEEKEVAGIPRYALFVGYRAHEQETEFGFECVVASADEIEPLIEHAGEVLPEFWWHIVDFACFGIVMKDTDLQQKKH